jgi:outer membrane protein assembly factor BamB
MDSISFPGDFKAASVQQLPSLTQRVASSAAVVNGVVYIGANSNVYALNAKTGAQLWSYTTGSSVTSSPAVANGMVYVGSDDGKVYAFGLK